MNNTKRLFAWVMSVVMLMSMLSSFGMVYAAQPAISNIDISGTGVGAAPSTDMAEFDVMADDVLIIDSSISALDDTYSLVWNNEQIDDIPVKGKVFKSFYAVQFYAEDNGIENPKIIVKKLDSNINEVEITMPLSLYSQAYNTMPFVVSENVLEPWAYNVSDEVYDDYDQLTSTLPAIKIAENVTGKIGIYGFTLKGAIDDSARKGALDIELVNTVVDSSASAVIVTENDVTKTSNSDSLVIKNLLVKKLGADAVVMSGYIPANVTVDGMFADGTVSAAVVKQAGLRSKFAVKNCYFGDVAVPFSFTSDAEMQRSAVKALEIKHNVIISKDASPVSFSNHSFTSITVTNNYVAVKEGAPALISDITAPEAFNETKLAVTVRDNIINGASGEVAFVDAANGVRDGKIDIADNYLNTAYAEDLEGVEGTELNANANGVICKSYYSDYKMTNKCNSAVNIVSVSATNGDVFVNNSTNTLYYIMNSGDATELTILLGNPEAIVKWYSDSNCENEIGASDVSIDSTESAYYLRSEYTNKEGTFRSQPYTVTVVRETPTIPYFTKAYTDPAGLISKNAIVCDVDCGWVTDGSLYVVDWQGEQYTFIKGVNLFESLDAATSFAKSNGIENPEFIIKDMNGAHTLTTKWFPSIPGKYFTENYATKPYIGKAGDPAEDWKVNVGTGDGQFNPAVGIQASGIIINGTEPEGDYELYGFGFTSCIEDTRSSNRGNCVNIHLENCYFNLTTWSWAIFVAKDAEPTTATPTDDFLYIKDSYIGSGATGRLYSGWQSSHITFDGLFLEAGGYSTSQDYGKQNGANASFRIINSHIKNYGTILNNQANNKEIKAGENKTFEISNTIFNNAKLHDKAAVTAYTRTWNNIKITDNVFINDNFEKFTMFQYLYQATISGNPCTLTVTGNKGYNMLGNFDFGSRSLASASVVENNYVTAEKYQGKDVTTYGGIKLQACNGTAPLKGGDYWVDSEMTVRPNVLMEDYNFVGPNVVTDKEAKTVKYVPLAENEIGVVVNQTNNGYEYVINLSHIIDNKYGNVMTISDGNTSVSAYNDLVIKSATLLDKIDLTLSVSSPDGTAKAVDYAVTITNDGPAIEGITVGGEAVTMKDGVYAIELSGRGMNENISVTANKADVTVEITKGGEPVTAVTTPNGVTEVYDIAVIYNGETVTAKLSVTRRGAEFSEFDEVLSKTDGIDDSKWLQGFKGVFQSLRSKMKALDRATATQTEVDEMTAKMQQIIDEAVTESEFNTALKEYKRIKNTDGKYCTVTYEALQDAIDSAYDKVKTVSDRESYIAIVMSVDTAACNLTGHKFTNYVHDKGTETCVGNGTKTATCDTVGCDEKKTVEETDKYATGKHVFTKYEYNGDATHLADGTKTAMCDTCGKVADTIAAAGTKLVLINSASKYTDVKANDWFKEYVDYVATYGFMTGTSDKTFAPSKTITRAEFVKLLANLSGVDTSNNAVDTKFTDVKKDSWYVGAVKWAADNGIVSGTSDTTFAPNAVITREQMCVMLVNYTKFTKITLKKTVEKSEFSDDAKISSWAKDAVYACQSAGIVSGKGNGFDPQGTAKRAEAAVIIKIFHENYLLA